MPRFLLVSLAVILTVSSASPTTAQPDDSTAIADSLQAALSQFKRAAPPTVADSAALRRWADSLTTTGNRIRGSAPATARGMLSSSRTAYRALADSVKSASLTKDIGVAHYYQGAIDVAVRHFRTGLKSSRQHGAQRVTASCMNWLAIYHANQGRYDEALDRWQMALSKSRALGDTRGASNYLNNIAIIYDQQDRNEKALPRYQESLTLIRTLDRTVKNRESIAIRLTNIAAIYEERGREEKALDQYREALSIVRDLGLQERIADLLGFIGGVHLDLGNGEKALQYRREALSLHRKTDNRSKIAEGLKGVGNVYRDRGNYEKALQHYERALPIFRTLEHPDQTALLEEMGEIALRQGRVQAAADTLERAVRLAEALRRNATSPEARRSLLSTEIGAYQALTTARVRLGRPDSALRSVEQARARLLADRLAGAATSDTSFTLPAVAELRRALGPDEATLLYANAESRWPLTFFVVTQDTIVAREHPGIRVRAAIEEEYPTRLNRLRQEEGPLTSALDQRPSTEQNTAPGLAEVIRLYRYYLTRGQTGFAIQNDLSRRLHGLLVKPIADVIADKSELIAIPTGTLGYLPFETLRDSAGTYLAEQKHVRYAQSLTVLRQLRQRDYGERERSLLALGGAAYEPDLSPGGGTLVAEVRGGSTRVETEKQASSLRRDAGRRLEQGKSLRPTYQELGYARWSDLPQTASEARRIGKMAGEDGTVITGAGVTEDSVRALNERNQLSTYRRVHFATHGVAVPETPELSALVLSQVGTSDSLAARDGYLTMEEIAGLEMKADVAVLSACQTGLGKVVAGEGVVSLSHAFLRAGANATLVSQWKVLDESTRQFMTAVYERVRAEDTSFAEAVTETKRAFIAGEYGEKNTDPLHWAPFVYYGRE